MEDILGLFLVQQEEEGMALAGASDVLDLQRLDERRFVASYHCKGFVRTESGAVREHDRFGVGIRLPESYLRLANPAEILTWLGPEEIWHPNISPPFVCVGDIAPGTPLVDLLHRCFELITYQNVTMREDDALNGAACAWARQHSDLFPLDLRPIKRRTHAVDPPPTEVRP
jgi:hypothetical protein